MNNKLQIGDFLQLASSMPVIDVRSPGEYAAGHIPFAVNIPLFSDEERARVGTVYKQRGRDNAIELGYEFVKPKLTGFLTAVEKLVQQKEKLDQKEKGHVLVHCWRGGMRSEAFAVFLNENGYSAQTLIRGYKAYRRYVLDSFNSGYGFILLGGETGSGKTEILRKISESGESVIDLEKLAHHKGSAFGSLGEKKQNSQEQFENDLSAELLRHFLTGKMIWLEDESRNIGTNKIPDPIWEKMKSSPILRISLPKEERIKRLISDYGYFSKDELSSCITKIQKRLGPQHAKFALDELSNGNLRAVADVALTYYDKAYNYMHELRNFKDVHFVESHTPDAEINAQKILEFSKMNLKKIHV